MTAATARTATSGKPKRVPSTSSKAAAAQGAASETIAELLENDDEQIGSVDERAEFEQAEDVVAQSESAYEQAEGEAAETVLSQPVSASEPTETAAATLQAAAMTLQTAAATLQTAAATLQTAAAVPQNAATTQQDAPETSQAVEAIQQTASALPTTVPASYDIRDEAPRFRIFIIDSGWNHAATKVLKENFDLIHLLTHEDPIYVLDREKSVTLLRKNKGLIGHDPILAVHDLNAVGRHEARGFRLHLGLLNGETECLTAMKNFLRFLGTHRDAQDLQKQVRRKLHKQGLEGAIEIVGGAAHHVVMEA